MKKAKDAVNVLHDWFMAKHPRVIGQTPAEVTDNPLKILSFLYNTCCTTSIYKVKKVIAFLLHVSMFVLWFL